MRHHLGILKCGVSLEGLFKSGVSLENCKGCLEPKIHTRGWIGIIIQLYCLKACVESLELVEPQAWD